MTDTAQMAVATPQLEDHTVVPDTKMRAGVIPARNMPCALASTFVWISGLLINLCHRTRRFDSFITYIRSGNTGIATS